jgi:hypothetical protein
MNSHSVLGSDPHRLPAAPQLVLGSAHLSDGAFVDRFERCAFPNASFTHADHLRLGWVYLRTSSDAVAEQRMAQSIARFAAHAGAHRKFHVTMTIGWMRLLQAAMWLTPQIDTFDAFIDGHTWLLARGALDVFYSKSVLTSDAARSSWVEPDLKTFSMNLR